MKYKKPIVINMALAASAAILVPSSVLIAKKMSDSNPQRTFFEVGSSIEESNPYGDSVPRYNADHLLNLPFDEAVQHFRLALKRFPGYYKVDQIKTQIPAVDAHLTGDFINSEDLFPLIAPEITKLNIEFLVRFFNNKHVYTDFGPKMTFGAPTTDEHTLKTRVKEVLDKNITDLTKSGVSTALLKINYNPNEIFVHSDVIHNKLGIHEISIETLSEEIERGAFNGNMQDLVSSLENQNMYFKREVMMTGTFNKFIKEYEPKYSDPNDPNNIEVYPGTRALSSVYSSNHVDPYFSARRRGDYRYIDGMRSGGDTGHVDGTIFFEPGALGAVTATYDFSHQFRSEDNFRAENRINGLPLSENSGMFDLLTYNSNDLPDAAFNRARIPLNTKLFHAKQLNESQGKGHFTIFGTSGEFNSADNDLNPNTWLTAKYNTHWQYVDRYVAWPQVYRPIAIPEAQLIDTAHKNGAKVFATVFNAINFDMLGSMMTYRDGKNLFIQKMVDMAKDRGFDGWYFNWETWYSRNNPRLTQFLRDWYTELAMTFKQEGLEYQIYSPVGTDTWRNNHAHTSPPPVSPLPVNHTVDYASPAGFQLYTDKKYTEGSIQVLGNNYTFGSDIANAKKTIFALRAIQDAYGFDPSFFFHLNEAKSNRKQPLQRNMFDDYYQRQKEVWAYMDWQTSINGNDPISNGIRSALGINNKFEHLPKDMDRKAFWGNMGWFAGGNRNIEQDMDFYTSNHYFGMQGTPGFDPNYFKMKQINSLTWFTKNAHTSYGQDIVAPVPYQSRDPRINVGNSIARFFNETSVLDNVEFHSSFDRGFGKETFLAGAKTGLWFGNPETQDILPTYNWIIDRYDAHGDVYDIKTNHYTTNTVSMKYANNDAWQGHNSLNYKGIIKPNESIVNKLYAVKYDDAKIQYVTKGDLVPQLAVTNAGTEEYVTNSKKVDLANGWHKYSFEVNHSIDSVGVKFTNTTGQSYDLSKQYLGSVSINERPVASINSAIDNIKMEGNVHHAWANLRLTWDNNEDLVYYFVDSYQNAVRYVSARNAAYINKMHVFWSHDQKEAKGSFKIKIFTRSGEYVGEKDMNFNVVPRPR